MIVFSACWKIYHIHLIRNFSLLHRLTQLLLISTIIFDVTSSKQLPCSRGSRRSAKCAQPVAFNAWRNCSNPSGRLRSRDNSSCAARMGPNRVSSCAITSLSPCVRQRRYGNMSTGITSSIIWGPNRSIKFLCSLFISQNKTNHLGACWREWPSKYTDSDKKMPLI